MCLGCVDSLSPRTLRASLPLALGPYTKPRSAKRATSESLGYPQTAGVGRAETINAQRRLDPTPWLNVNFREPLYLKDVPVQHDDTRNELERKFPEFFYNKLSGEVRGH